MIVVAQRVSRATVSVAGVEVGAIGPGLCLLACAVRDDRAEEVDWLADKLAGLRIFADSEGLANRSLLDTGGGALVVPQFTLAAAWRKGRRPSFTEAAGPARAEALVARLAARLASHGIMVAGGRFGAQMALELVNDGPFTLVLDSRQQPGSARSPDAPV